VAGQQLLGDDWTFLMDVMLIKLVARVQPQEQVSRRQSVRSSWWDFAGGGGGDGKSVAGSVKSHRSQSSPPRNGPGEILLTTRGCIVAASTQFGANQNQSLSGAEKRNAKKSTATVTVAGIGGIEAAKVTICVSGEITEVDSYTEAKQIKNAVPVDVMVSGCIHGVATERKHGPVFMADIWDDLVREKLLDDVRRALVAATEDSRKSALAEQTQQKQKGSSGGGKKSKETTGNVDRGGNEDKKGKQVNIV